jgi:SAM-dependent methyltransferase
MRRARVKETQIKKTVREGYAKIAKQSSCGCCGGGDLAEQVSHQIGYSEEELEMVPQGANLGLGCGNPIATASLREGEVVVDLGSGAGFDCFLAARKVGKEGKVIGIDMTPEMIEKARENKEKGNFKNVEFRLGEIENLPVANNSADILISNCVINLSTDKPRVFAEAFRVLKPGGRITVSDIVLLEPLPDVVKGSIEAYISCIAGASMKEDYIEAIKAAGFKDVRIMNEIPFPIECIANAPVAQSITKEDLSVSRNMLKDLASSIVSVNLCAVKS